MRLTGEIRAVESIHRDHKRQMFDLLSAYFEGADEDVFQKDLAEKQWVILLLDAVDGTVQGFSTQMLIEHTVDGEAVKALFSGDTIINRDYWGEHELARQWLRLVEGLFALYPRSRLYWFLISKGYKTYRFLPVYFKEFYPRYDRDTPEQEQRIMDAFGYLKYPRNYSGKDGLIRFPGEAMRLKDNFAGVDCRRLKDPHIRFFIRRNPGYRQGDELVCLAPLSYDNFKPSVFKGRMETLKVCKESCV
jgi:hypothetical protein